ncbi:MAG TPA: hypothetical protein VKB96_12490 [Gammaproteobacteria bacterium]|nr:hypothetical protein [Gammaproteobacteria bacterium]
MKVGRHRQSNHHLPPNMRHRHGAYYYDYGKRKSPEGKTYEWLSRDLKTAKLKWAKLEAGDAEPEQGTFAALAKTYQENVLLDKAKATQELNNICVTKLVKSFGHMRPASIKPHHIYAYLDANPAKVAGNRQLSVMSAIFNLGIRKGLLTSNPCKQVRRNKETPRDRYIEDHEFEAVKALASERFALVMDIA